MPNYHNVSVPTVLYNKDFRKPMYMCNEEDQAAGPEKATVVSAEQSWGACVFPGGAPTTRSGAPVYGSQTTCSYCQSNCTA